MTKLVDVLVVITHGEDCCEPVLVLVASRPPGDVADHLVLPLVDVLVFVDQHVLEPGEETIPQLVGSYNYEQVITPETAVGFFDDPVEVDLLAAVPFHPKGCHRLLGQPQSEGVVGVDRDLPRQIPHQ